MNNEIISQSWKPLAADELWHWLLVDDGACESDSSGENENPKWRLQWHNRGEARRHILRIKDSRLASALFPFSVLHTEETIVDIVAVPGRPLSSVNWRGLSQLEIRKLFEGLGSRLRHLHDMPAPSGFGDPEIGQRYQTINAFMAARFSDLSNRLQVVESEDLRDQSVRLLAGLRQELSIFHPHGRSCWTIGRLSADRMLYDEESGKIEGILDLGCLALRPPEYDLAALRAYGILTDHPVADRGFWKGYQAALTRDLERRFDYFGRLIELERLLGYPAGLQ